MGIEAKVNPPEWTWVEVAVDQTVDVVVCVIDSPGEFYCHVLKGDDGKLTLTYLRYIVIDNKSRKVCGWVMILFPLQ